MISKHSQLITSGPEDLNLIVKSLLIILWLAAVKNNGTSYLRDNENNVIMSLTRTVERIRELCSRHKLTVSLELPKKTAE